MAEKFTTIIDELIPLCTALFTDHTQYRAFSEKCAEVGLNTFINPSRLGWSNYKPRNADELRQRWTQVLQDAELAKQEQQLFDAHTQELAEKEAKKQQQAQDDLKAILTKAKNIQDSSLGDLRIWHSGKVSFCYML